MDLSLAGVFAAGLLTFLSPCVLPLVPVYLGILAGEAGEDASGGRFRTLVATALFALGFTAVFSLMGLTATVVGRALVSHKLLFQQLGGIVILLLGLRFVGWLKVPFLENAGAGGGLARFKTRFHYLNVFVLGLLFAFAWTPCIGSVLGAVLTYTSLQTTDPLTGVLYLSAYGLGFAVPLMAVAAVAGPALAALRKARRFIPAFERATGALLAVLGLLLVTDQLGLVDSAFGQAPAVPVETTASEGSRAAANPFALAGEAASCGGDAGPAGTGTGATCDGGIQAARPRMVKFYSPSCPICLQMIPVVNVLRNECAARDVSFDQVDISTADGRALARKYGVTGIPVFVFEDASGREVSRLVGFQPLEALEQAMSVLTGESCPAYREVPGM